MIDLHVHSNASDGELSPSDLMHFAADKGLSLIALTDHDTVAGLADAEKAAALRSITLVSGVELNIDWPTGEFHLLGLGLVKPADMLLELIDTLQRERDERNKNIVKKMRSDGFDISLEKLQADSKAHSIGRPHFAEYLIKKRLVKTRQQAFDTFFGKGRPYYIGRKGADLCRALEAISLSGGVPVLAHPLSLYVSWGKIGNILSCLREKGVRGLEAWHPGVRVVDCKRLEEMGRQCGFFITAGSDFHGESVRADRKIGKTSGKLKIDDRFWTEELQPALKNT